MRAARSIVPFWDALGAFFRGESARDMTSIGLGATTEVSERRKKDDGDAAPRDDATNATRRD